MKRTIAPARTTVSVLLAAATLLAAALTIGVAAGRWQAAPVLTGSMEPALPAGALAVARTVPTSELAAGDVIVFHAPVAGRPVTVHRVETVVHREGAATVTTKGDANEEADGWGGMEISASRTWVVDRAIPVLGSVVLAMRSPLAQFAAMVLLALAVATALDSWRTRRRDAAPPSSVSPAGQAATPPPPVLPSSRALALPRPPAPIMRGWFRAPASVPVPPAVADHPARRHRFSGAAAAVVAAVLLTPVALLLISGGARAAYSDLESDTLTVRTGGLDAPTGLAAVTDPLSGTCTVDLTWTPAASPAAEGYELLRQPLSGELLEGGEPAGPLAVVAFIAGRTTASYVDNPPVDPAAVEARFRYVLRAVRGAWRSPDSNAAEVTLLSICAVLESAVETSDPVAESVANLEPGAGAGGAAAGPAAGPDAGAGPGAGAVGGPSGSPGPGAGGGPPADSEPALEPVIDPATEPVDEPVADPAPDPVIEPVV